MSKLINFYESYNTSIFALKHGKQINEDIGDWYNNKKKSKKENKEQDDVKKEQKINKEDLFNIHNNILNEISSGNYNDVLNQLKQYNINASSPSINGLNIFGKKFESLPFVFGAIGYSISHSGKQLSVSDICDTIISILTVVFSNSIDICLQLKTNEVKIYDDLISFSLTYGGTIDPASIKYNEENDTAILQIIKTLTNLGWNIGNIIQSTFGLSTYIFKQDLYLTFKYLMENGLISVESSQLKTFGIDEANSKIGSYLISNAPHPFKLHEPDVSIDEKGNIISDTDGLFAGKMNSLGYNVTQNNDIQGISYNTLMSLQDELAIIVNRYTSKDGEKISNLNQINMFKGSNFDINKSECRKLINDFNTLVNGKNWFTLNTTDKTNQLTAIAKRFSNIISSLEKTANNILTIIHLPQISIHFNTDTSSGITAENIENIMKEMGARIPEKPIEKSIDKKEQEEKNDNNKEQNKNNKNSDTEKTIDDKENVDTKANKDENENNVTKNNEEEK